MWQCVMFQHIYTLCNVQINQVEYTRFLKQHFFTVCAFKILSSTGKCGLLLSTVAMMCTSMPKLLAVVEPSLHTTDMLTQSLDSHPSSFPANLLSASRLTV